MISGGGDSVSVVFAWRTESMCNVAAGCLAGQCPPSFAMFERPPAVHPRHVNHIVQQSVSVHNAEI